MNTRFKRNLGVLAIVSVMGSLMFTPRQTARGELAWLTSLSAALEESKTSGKPILIDFFATWCGPCRMLDSHTYSDWRVEEESKHWVMLRIDIDQQPGLAQEYGVRAVPTMIYLDRNGKEMARDVGFVRAADLVEQMHQLRGKIPYAAPPKR